MLKLCNSKKLHSPLHNPCNMRPTLTNIWFSLRDGMFNRRCQDYDWIWFKRMLCTELLNKTPAFETKIKQFVYIRLSRETHAIFVFFF